MSRPLFVYGTLHPRLAPGQMRDVVNRLIPIGAATVKGVLYDFGRYPGLRLDEAKHDVHGYLFQLPSDPTVLERLDWYEGVGAGESAGGLFVRLECTARLANGTTVLCWTYVYNQPVGAASVVSNGNWIDPKLEQTRL